MIVASEAAIFERMAKGQQQERKPARNDESTATIEQPDSPFRYYVPGEKPRTDQAYFELLMLKLARAKGDLTDFDEVWPRGVQALAGMNLLRLSTYSPTEVRESIASVGGEFSLRMTPHAESIVRWAAELWRIRQVYGTIRRYLRTLESDGFEVALEDLKSRLPGLTGDFLVSYLRDAGEKVPMPEKQAIGRPQQQRPAQPVDTRGQDPQRRAQQSQQQAQQQQKQDDGRQGRGDRRRRQRGRGGPRPNQQQPQQQQPIVKQSQMQPAALAADSAGGDAVKDPQQQQRRRNRRRFFRRRRAGGDKPSAPASE